MSNAANLSELVAKAHLMRATERSKTYAQRFGVLVHVYRARNGFDVDVANPTVQDYWRVAPSGTVTQVSSGS